MGAEGRGGGVRKGMFYNEQNQRRALTLAARTNGVGPRAWKQLLVAIEFPRFQIPARERFSRFIASARVNVNPPPLGP